MVLEDQVQQYVFSSTIVSFKNHNEIDVILVVDCSQFLLLWFCRPLTFGRGAERADS